jgi:nucleotide-binding universal stress UspA family protein
MSNTDTQVLDTATAGMRGKTPPAPLIAIVGFDGTDAARQALRAATGLIAGRNGQVEVIYVAHAPGLAAMSADAEVGMLEGFDTIQRELSLQVRDLIGPEEQRWAFHRRDGGIAHELLAAANGLREEHGSKATIVIVVGSSVHAYHQVIGSVPVSLARQSQFAVLVVPVVHVAA